ncbi:hypothetical protein ALC53_01712 [Atta colombica]|uniref:Uncharacterized protein n=1 Tax=Atta colombica TaxID=520822 RepID=A0A195BUS5_9HYME|nr:hypothetical protein ALC53_01712 [Atta colombica]
MTFLRRFKLRRWIRPSKEARSRYSMRLSPRLRDFKLFKVRKLPGSIFFRSPSDKSRCLRLVKLSKRPGIKTSCATGALKVSRSCVSMSLRSFSWSHHAVVLFFNLQSPLEVNVTYRDDQRGRPPKGGQRDGQAEKRWPNADKPGDPGNSYQRIIIASAIINVGLQIRGGTVCTINTKRFLIVSKIFYKVEFIFKRHFAIVNTLCTTELLREFSRKFGTSDICILIRPSVGPEDHAILIYSNLVSLIRVKAQLRRKDIDIQLYVQANRSSFHNNCYSLIKMLSDCYVVCRNFSLATYKNTILIRRKSTPICATLLQYNVTCKAWLPVVRTGEATTWRTVTCRACIRMHTAGKVKVELVIMTIQPMFICGYTAALACSANELDASNDTFHCQMQQLEKKTLKIKPHRIVVKRDTSDSARFQKFRKANMKVLREIPFLLFICNILFSNR